jgi:radical SAM protein (TIGR01212 family)
MQVKNPMAAADKRYNDLNTYLRKQFGCRVQKITVDAGLTCPNRDGTISTRGCIFCNDRGSGTGAHNRGLTITQQIEQGQAALSKRYKARKFLAYFQSFSNTYAPVETLRRLYEEAISVDGIVGISIGTRPDCIDRDKIALLQEMAGKCLVWVEYGLQSAHDSTLSLINRGHDAACFARAVEKTQNRGIQICAHVILGLPGETNAHVHQTAKFISRLSIHGIKLHLLYVIKGTRLETMYRQKSYRCLTQAAYVDLVCDFLERIPSDMIVQRLTSDPHPHELVAPRWSLNKMETLSRIKAELERRNTCQGKLS